MKRIKNESRQGIEIMLDAPGGSQSKWLPPKQEVIIPDGAISEQIKTLQHRRMLTVSDA
jgi:hypothetical protein